MKNLYLAFLFLALFASCQMEPVDPYARAIVKQRFTKDSFFKSSPNSPLDNRQKQKFVELDYYEPDQAYQLKADVELLPADTTKEAINQEFKLLKFARLHFKLNSKDLTLMAYKNFEVKGENHDMLFVPFYDLTNEKDTYHGGRFMDIRYSGGKTLELDFNYAYSPSCAYSENFSCPMPPMENKLPLRIEAGEKMYNPYFR